MDADTRTRLLDAALLLFRQRGYHGVGVRDILVAARAPKGSLYHHFPGGKEQIAVEVLERVAGQVVEMIERDRGSDAASVMRSVGQRLRKWMHATHAAAPDSSACALIASFAAEGDTAAAVAAAARTAYQRIATALVARLLADGAAPRAARDTAYLVIAALEGGGLVSQTLGEPRLFTAAIEQAAQLCAQAAASASARTYSASSSSSLAPSSSVRSSSARSSSARTLLASSSSPSSSSPPLAPPSPPAARRPRARASSRSARKDPPP